MIFSSSSDSFLLTVLFIISAFLAIKPTNIIRKKQHLVENSRRVVHINLTSFKFGCTVPLADMCSFRRYGYVQP